MECILEDVFDTLNQNLKDKKVLIVGCGSGEDAVRLSKMGAEVYAFDLSHDMLMLAQELATKEGVNVDFRQMPAEYLNYEDSFFDCIVTRDILHHVEIRAAMSEIARVSKCGAFFVMDEIYSHSVTDKIRRSKIVENFFYPIMVNYIYHGKKPYITHDERKLTERDISLVKKFLVDEKSEYFNFVVTRLIPDKIEMINKIDFLLLRIFRIAGPLLAGRILLTGRVLK